MEMTLNTDTFEALEQKEMYEVDGGGALAALYMVAFICNTTPLGICVSVGVGLVAGVVAGVLVNNM